MNGRARLRRAAALATTVALALGVAACGDEADGDGGSERDADARAEVEATIRDTWKRFAAAAKDSAAAADYCSKLTPAYQKAQVTASFGSATTCPDAVAKASRAWHRRGYGDLPVKLLSISVKGREAVVKTTGGVVGHDTYRLRLVNVGGEWKLPADALEPLSD